MNPAQPQSVEEYLIRQDWGAYSHRDHHIWAQLTSACLPELRKHACHEYLEGVEQIGIREDLIPDLHAVNAKLQALTSWVATPVVGFLPAPVFFEMLASRRFPTTTRIRSQDSLGYTPEPDIFHDVFGHVPMHTHRVFARFLQHYGAVCAQLKSQRDLERMGRLFWFTVEFGLIRQTGSVKAYGSGLISSRQELDYVIHGGPEIRDFNLDEVFGRSVSTSQMQSVLYAVESFEQVYDAMHEAEKRIG